jgi:hypothetical protein
VRKLLALFLLLAAPFAHLRWTQSKTQRFCADTAPGSALADFRARAKAAGFMLRESPDKKQVSTVDRWLLMSLGCSATYEGERLITVETWSVG